MPSKLIQQLLETGKLALQIIGATSLLSALGFLTAYYAFPPNLSIEEVKDKGPHNFESRLVVKNIGSLPAYNVIVDVSKMNLVVGGLNMSNFNTVDCGIPTSKIASGEKMEIPACPQIGMPVGTNLRTCDYDLTLKYQFRLPFYKTVVEKRWHIELRNSGSEYTWQIALR